MDDDEIEIAAPSFKMGVFVRCAYDFYHFFSSWYDEDNSLMPFHGVVVDIMDDQGFYGESVYQVYCLDGQYRFFLQDEMELVDSSLIETP